jgi:hypothetical protein
MTQHGMLASWGAAAWLLVAGCTGYSELPFPLREQATLQVEALELFPGDVGRLQVKLDLEAVGPWVLVSNPEILEANLSVVSWALGVCPGLGEPGADPSLRLCIAAYWDGSAAIDSISLGLIAQRVADGQRFTVFGASTP